MRNLAKQMWAQGTAAERTSNLANLSSTLETLKARMRIAVIFGGDKREPGSVLFEAGNSRSWKSYEAVALDIAAALNRLGFAHVQLMPDDMTLCDRLRREGIHMAWLNTAGVQGYNPAAHAAAMLEMMGVPYVGHDPLAATTLDNKHAFKREAVCAGLPTARFSTWHMARGSFCPALNTRFRRAFGDFSGPFVVKPVSGRASLHVEVVECCADLPEAIARIHGITGDAVLIEEYLPGREFCIAVAGPVTARNGTLERQSGAFTFAALERLLDEDERIFTSMDVRPITGARCRPLGPRDRELCNRLHDLAREVYLEFNLRSVIRLDVRADHAGNLQILEANPKPDLKRPGSGGTSLICEGLDRYGMSYEDLILSFIADRIDFLFTHRATAVRHLIDLSQARSSLPVRGFEAGGAALGVKSSISDLCSRQLHSVAEAAAHAEAAGDFRTAARSVQSLSR